MITLYCLPPLDRAPSLSPFSMKVETYLRMTGTPYRCVHVVDAQRGPKGKVPYIEDGSVRLGDSGLILEHLARTRGHSLDAGLSPAEHATGHAVRRMLEEHFYWVVVYSRWFHGPHWPRMREVFLGHLPRPVARAVGEVARVAMRRTLRAHGIGRHHEDEMFALGRADLDALSATLGERSFLLGDEPRSYDAIAHAFVASVLDVDMDTPLRAHARGLENLVAYGDRMRARYYPEIAAPSASAPARATPASR
ncbi:glutathione S-transferase family protein [Sandaracinus amylolyticus]|nr:glutathione S-transferase family protein [Sandaracinus amylolyticus]